MSNTFVYDASWKKNALTAIGYDEFGQVDDGLSTSIPGDGGVYSTVDDLFKWDQAPRYNSRAPAPTSAEAFAPGKVHEGTSTYGFGWNIEQDRGSKYLWHQGSHAGFRAFIPRRREALLLSSDADETKEQKRRSRRFYPEHPEAGKPYVLPRHSGAEKLYRTIHESGQSNAALQMFDAFKKSADYDLGESELNTLGYQLLYGDRRVSDAVAIFKLNAIEHPLSSNAFDSLGEAYRVNGERNLAIISYTKAALLDPTNGHAAGELKKLSLGRALWLALLTIGAIGVSLVAVILVKRRRTRPRVGRLPKT